MFEVRFGERNVRLSGSQWLFTKRHSMRFEWLALLAYRRQTKPADQSWVTIKDIARLPHWRGRSEHHIATNIGRYLQEMERNGTQVVTAKSFWAGPYRLAVMPSQIAFDLPTYELKRELCITEVTAVAGQEDYLRFTWRYVQAQRWVHTGHLSARGNDRRMSAYREFLRLTEDRSYPSHLRFLACLAAVNVQYRLGLFQMAAQTLGDYKHLLRSVKDASLKARYHLAVAWGLHRSASDRRTHKQIEGSLNLATALASNSGDRAVLGEVAERMGAYYTKNDLHEEAIRFKLQGLEAHLITGNFDRLQTCAANIGSVVHRLGEKHYRAARRWLLLSLRISHWMQVGRDSAHTEIILAKMDIEMNRRSRARYWLDKAETVAKRASHSLYTYDAKMVWALWHQAFGEQPATKRLLIETVRGYRTLQYFDSGRKEQYLARKFPELWPDVLDAVES